LEIIDRKDSKAMAAYLSKIRQNLKQDINFDSHI